MELFLVLTLTLVVGAFFLKAVPAEAHCDTLSGPVIQAARRAFEKEDLRPVLKWIRSDDEQEIRKDFARACKVRSLGPEARELAEKSFFETLVRIHRAGEGAPFEGLKPDSSVPPVVGKADSALESGDVSELANRISSHVKKTVEERFQKAWEKKPGAEDSAEKGREFVEAYISFVHYVEGIHEMTMGGHGEHRH
jgi:hypothetical protein